MRVNYTKRFLKSAARLPARIVDIAAQKEALFKELSFHPSLETHKLHGKNADAWSFSVTKKYRIKFIFLEEGGVLFLDIGTHDIYK